ncbi:MAG: PilZ domain-containing protein [Nostoc sp.]|uniref:PilZ domain-containing protein n=1 Tax=Nostoc sp. TaxID=1180 RepID=UPI002FF6291B
MIGITLLILIDAPKADTYEWFNLRRIVQLRVGDHNLWSVTTMISEAGVEIALTQKLPINLFAHQLINIGVIEESLWLTGEVVNTGFKDESFTVRLRFKSVSLNQHRRLVEMLFCRPGQWKRQNAPGELHSLLLIFKIFLKPQILSDKKVDVRAMTVSQI